MLPRRRGVERVRGRSWAAAAYEVLHEAVPDALVEVAHALRDDDAAPDAERDRVERRAQHHVGVDVQHERLFDLRLLRPEEDGRRLVVRAGRLVVVRVVEHVRVDERRSHGHATRRVLAPLRVGAREQPRDPARHARDAVAVEDAGALPVKVSGALGAEDGVQAEGVEAGGGVVPEEARGDEGEGAEEHAAAHRDLQFALLFSHFHAR